VGHSGFDVVVAVEEVAVVISHLNSARTLAACLSRVVAQDYPSIHVALVDGGSTDGSIEIAKRFGVESMVVRGCSESRGQSLGIESTKSKIICFTNSDCYVPKDWVSRHVAWQHKGFNMVGGKVFWGGDDYGFAWSYWTPPTANDFLTSGLSLGWSNCSISRGLYDALGILDIKSHQDMDFWLRGMRLGLVKMIMDPEIEIYHDHPLRSMRNSFRRAFAYARNHVLLLRMY
jgi:GT2 family glycosyltransferase